MQVATHHVASQKTPACPKRCENMTSTLAIGKLLPGSVALTELTYGTPHPRVKLTLLTCCSCNFDIISSESQRFTFVYNPVIFPFLISTLHWPRNSSMWSHEDQESQAPQRQSLEIKSPDITSTSCALPRICFFHPLVQSGKMNESIQFEKM